MQEPVNLEMTAVIHSTFINYLLSTYIVLRTVLDMGFECDDKLAIFSEFKV